MNRIIIKNIRNVSLFFITLIFGIIAFINSDLLSNAANNYGGIDTQEYLDFIDGVYLTNNYLLVSCGFFIVILFPVIEVLDYFFKNFLNKLFFRKCTKEIFLEKSRSLDKIYSCICSGLVLISFSIGIVLFFINFLDYLSYFNFS